MEKTARPAFQMCVAMFISKQHGEESTFGSTASGAQSQPKCTRCCLHPPQRRVSWHWVGCIACLGRKGEAATLVKIQQHQSVGIVPRGVSTQPSEIIDRGAKGTAPYFAI